MRTGCKLLIAAAVFAAYAAAQAPAGYIDAYVVKVKPEKRAEFESIARKFADANRKYKGDIWIAYGVEYGDQSIIRFSAVRESFAAIDKAGEAFMRAMKEGYGPGFMKMLQDSNNCLLSSRGEVRRRRADLSWNMPADQAALEKLVGESKWVRTLEVRARPGRGADYEEQVKVLKAAFEKAADGRPGLVSQSLSGQPLGTYYFSSFGKSLADFDTPANLRELMGAEAYERYQKAANEDTFGAEWSISRILPELSNPPEGIAGAAPQFWRPKPPAVAKPKASPAPAAKPGT